jgi:hypothetical protein
MLHLQFNHGETIGGEPVDITNPSTKKCKFTVKPRVQHKINEYFLIWLSMEEHQAFIVDELKKLNIDMPFERTEVPKPLKSLNSEDSAIQLKSNSMELLDLLENSNFSVLSGSPSTESMGNNMPPPFSPKLASKRFENTQVLAEVSEGYKIDKDQFTDINIDDLKGSSDILQSNVLALKRLNTTKEEDQDDDVPEETDPPANEIPAFFFPFGRPASKAEERRKRHAILTQGKEIFGIEGVLSEREFAKITEICSLPRYLNCALFRKCDSKGKSTVAYSDFSRLWKTISQKYFDEESIIYAILKQEKNEYLVYDDFLVILEGNERN